MQAEELTGTLKKIKDSQTISVGHRESSIPFSYYDGKNQVVGFSHDLAMKVVEAVKQKLALPNLQVRLIPVTAQNRIPLIQNGTIDIEAGSTTNNLERQQQVNFSDTMFIISTRLLVKKDSGINDFPDLKGKNVVVTAGSTSERLIREMNEKNNMGMNIIRAKDHGESFLTLQSSRAVAFMLDDALLAGGRFGTHDSKRGAIAEARECIRKSRPRGFPRSARSWSNVPGAVGARPERPGSREFCSYVGRSFPVQRARMFPAGSRALSHVAMLPRSNLDCTQTFSSQCDSGGSLSTR
jgi:Bacterial extracellular solute-binding proteins, family 3